MKKLIIGLTGGIGSGKTTVSNIFSGLNIDIVDADIVAREVVAPGTHALNAIAQHFGEDYIDQKKQLNREKLRTKIFNEPKEKAWLNELLHPIIREEMLTQLSKASSPYCILVAPLLLENGLEQFVDRVLVVDVDEASQIKRTISRDPSSETEVRKIIASQISRSKRLDSADDVINNQSTSLAELRVHIVNLDKQYQKLAEQQFL